jgi:hypothetical protein
MDMPKNDASPGMDVVTMPDTYMPPQDVYVPDTGKDPCLNGIKYDNTKLPGWPNLPQP